MREIRFADVDSIEPGTVLTFERGVTGKLKRAYSLV